ncbi:MAG: phosphomethylpyrimidine kinase [Methanomicrobiales archaeon HGW-Methanomicrobiales-4]|nr:MAG: phosphomethylpyrimidine kinase [Methanomicrobiales archaeon HGW-Methanomicrobiales-4]
MPSGTIDALIRELEEASERLDLSEYPALIPDEGVQIAYALPAARGKEDVAVLSNGRISIASDFPASRMVLTAMRFDPSIRCVIIIRYNKEILSACNAMMMEICTFDRAHEPPGIPTIDWGVAFCSEKSDGVPDIIYDLGSAGKDPLIRVLGENPTRLSTSLNRILARNKYTNLKEE